MANPLTSCVCGQICWQLDQPQGASPQFLDKPDASACRLMSQENLAAHRRAARTVAVEGEVGAVI